MLDCTLTSLVEMTFGIRRTKIILEDFKPMEEEALESP